MNRRTFLVTSVSGLAAATAGCSGLSDGHTALGRPTEALDDDGTEKHLVYESDGERLLAIALDQTTKPRTPTDAFQFRLHIEHPHPTDDEGTTVERFRFDLRAPPSSVEPPADIYLRSPSGGLWPDYTFEQVDDFWTRIAVNDTGEFGGGTITLATIVAPDGRPVDEVGVRAEVELTEAGPFGTTYLAEAQTRFEPVRAR